MSVTMATAPSKSLTSPLENPSVSPSLPPSLPPSFPPSLPPSHPVSLPPSALSRGVPAVVDFAAMRDAVKNLGGSPDKINPIAPVDLVIDHSVQVDVFRREDALERNQEIEFQRNKERFQFLKWGAKAFKNMLIVPPGCGIVHQVGQVIVEGPLTGYLGY